MNHQHYSNTDKWRIPDWQEHLHESHGVPNHELVDHQSNEGFRSWHARLHGEEIAPITTSPFSAAKQVAGGTAATVDAHMALQAVRDRWSGFAPGTYPLSLEPVLKDVRALLGYLDEAHADLTSIKRADQQRSERLLELEKTHRFVADERDAAWEQIEQMESQLTEYRQWWPTWSTS